MVPSGAMHRSELGGGAVVHHLGHRPSAALVVAHAYREAAAVSLAAACRVAEQHPVAASAVRDVRGQRVATDARLAHGFRQCRVAHLRTEAESAVGAPADAPEVRSIRRRRKGLIARVEAQAAVGAFHAVQVQPGHFTCAVISRGSLQVAPSSLLEVIHTSRGASPSRISASPACAASGSSRRLRQKGSQMVPVSRSCTGAGSPLTQPSSDTTAAPRRRCARRQRYAAPAGRSDPSRA